MYLVVKKIFSWITLFCFLTTIFHFHPHFDHINEETIENIVDYKNDLEKTEVYEIKQEETVPYIKSTIKPSNHE